MAYESLLLCKKCHSNLVVPKRIIVRKLTVFVWARCSHCKKAVKFTLPLPQVRDWVDLMAQNFFKCPKCGITGVITRTVQSGDFTKLRLYCSSCQKAFTKVAHSSVYNYLIASHVNQMKVRTPLQAVPQYYVPAMQFPAVKGPVQRPFIPNLPPVTPPVSTPAARSASKPSTTSKKCTNCNAPLSPDAVFCRKCGVPVEAGVDQAPRCPFCGATLSVKAQICPKCSSQVRCLKCDTLLSPNARFCIKCGEPLKREVEEVEAPILTCHFCGAALELDQKVCPECGKPVVCPNCGNHLKSGIRFCNNCGTNVCEITMMPPGPEDEEEAEEIEDAGSEPSVKKIKCPECGAEMSETYTFCTICGTKLEH
ncbi:MAG: zinc-ribbon domain-containing protein [Candidatus Helarchaeota archaeon]